MAPKTQFKKEDIIDAAFMIACEEGTGKITVRSVADKLGCSVAPIYVNFKTSQQLVDEVIQKIHKIAEDLRIQPYTDIAFLNMGLGAIKFAMEYPVIFKEFVMLENSRSLPNDEEFEFILGRMHTMEELKNMPEASLKEIFWKMMVFTNGLGVLTATHSLPEGMGWDQLVELLRDTGYDIINSTKAKLMAKEGKA